MCSSDLPRTKFAAPRHGPHLKKRHSEPRGDPCEFDEDTQRYVPASVRAMKAKEAQRIAIEKAKFVQAQMEREAVYDSLETIIGMSKEEFREMRKRKLYDLPSNSNDHFYPWNEMKLIKEELYDKITDKKKVCPQHPLNMTFLCSNEYFSEPSGWPGSLAWRGSWLSSGIMTFLSSTSSLPLLFFMMMISVLSSE